MDQGVREAVRRRAGNVCEYCRMPQQATSLIAFHVEHIVPRQHAKAEWNSDDPGGLALACDRCNAYKGPNLTSINPVYTRRGGIVQSACRRLGRSL
jgi:5-methylcytosine-specific restriction endonuclease McrA